MSALPFKVSMALAEYRRIQALGQTKRVELSATNALASVLGAVLIVLIVFGLCVL